MRTAAKAQTFRVSPPISGGVRAVLPTIIRGNNNALNRELLANNSCEDSAQQNYANHTNFANQIQYHMSAPPQRFHNSHHSHDIFG